jgi:DNA-binding NarL/FixJ family response regulator
MTASDPLQRLNKRQRDILNLISKGFHNAEVGRHMNLSERTVKGYISQLFLIFDVTNRTELVGRLLSEDLTKNQTSRSAESA